MINWLWHPLHCCWLVVERCVYVKSYVSYMIAMYHFLGFVTSRESACFLFVFMSIPNAIYLKICMIIVLFLFYVYCMLEFLRIIRPSYLQGHISFLSIILFSSYNKCILINSQDSTMKTLHCNVKNACYL